MITAEILADSISAEGKRLTTFLLRYPRMIHAEMMTHRLFSRNASSSRAIPVKRLIDDLLSNVAMPIHWGRNQPGMQAFEEHDGLVVLPECVVGGGTSLSVQNFWIEMANINASAALALSDAGYHKQIVNRILEPYTHINVVLSATEYANFIELRCHPDAQPEIKMLAELMRDALLSSTPKLLEVGDWHLPFITDADVAGVMNHFFQQGIAAPLKSEVNKLLRMVSAARCARTSYRSFHGKISTVEEDLGLCEKLAGGRPLHASPFEHQATPDTMQTVRKQVKDGEAWKTIFEGDDWVHPNDHRNFIGWRQSRAFFERDILGTN